MQTDFNRIFTHDFLDGIFPRDRADRFFDALYGDAGEGAYDIHLVFQDGSPDHLDFEFQLTQRPGKCLVCSLTYGLPNVFIRHPVINVKGLVQAIDGRLDGNGRRCGSWKLGATREVNHALHVLPLRIELVRAALSNT